MKHTAVMLMLCVITPKDPITALVKMDLLEMAKFALVNIKVENIDFTCCC